VFFFSALVVKPNHIMDGFIIVERGTNRVVFARQSPTLLASLTNAYQSIEEGNYQQKHSRDSIDTRRTALSSVLTAASQPKNISHHNDYINQNIVWAESIINYMNRVQQGSVPSIDGEFRVFTYTNNRMIVFTALNALLFIVVGDADCSELGLRETCKSIMEGCRSVCKRAPDDPEVIVKVRFTNANYN
jgi:hypothetical protein